MTNIVDYHDACKLLEKRLLNEDLAGVMAWKEQYHWVYFNEQQGCQPFSMIRNILHKFTLDKVGREKLSIMVSMLFSMLQEEPMDDIIKAKMICDFSARVDPEVMKPFFDKGGPLHVDPEDLNVQGHTLEGSYLRAETPDCHADGIRYALDKLAGWEPFDEAVTNRVVLTRRGDYLAAVLTHPYYHEQMIKRRFIANREALQDPEVLAFAFEHDKVSLSDDGFALALVIANDRADLVDAAIAQSVTRIKAHKHEDPVNNLRAVELYIKTHAKDTPLRERILGGLFKARQGIESDNAPSL